MRQATATDNLGFGPQSLYKKRHNLSSRSAGVQAFDGSSGSKWLDFGAGGGAPAWLEAAITTPAAGARLTGYALVSAGDAPEREPREWVVEGLPCGGAPAASDSTAPSAAAIVSDQPLTPDAAALRAAFAVAVRTHYLALIAGGFAGREAAAAAEAIKLASAQRPTVSG